MSFIAFFFAFFFLFSVHEIESSQQHNPQKKYRCSFRPCKKKYLRHSHLASHINTQHTHKKRYPCTRPGCTECFLRKDTLKRHEATVHDNIRPFSCEGCFHKCKRPDHLKVHKKTCFALKRVRAVCIATALAQTKPQQNEATKPKIEALDAESESDNIFAQRIATAHTQPDHQQNETPESESESLDAEHESGNALYDLNNDTLSENLGEDEAIAQLKEFLQYSGETTLPD